MSYYEIMLSGTCFTEEGRELFELYNKYGRGRITETQFIALYLENKLEDYIEKVKADE